MSTKTTFKRIALVAVAALGLGVLSVAPSQATQVPGSDSFTLSANSATVGIGDTASVTLTQTFISGATDDSMTVTVTSQSTPDTPGSAFTLGIYTTDSANALTRTSSSAQGNVGKRYNDYQGVAGTAIGTNVSATLSATAASTSASLTSSVRFMAPTVAGTYVFRIFAGHNNTGVVGTSAAPQTFTLTVSAANTTATAAASKIWINKAITGSIIESDSALVLASGLATDASASVAKIWPIFNNSADTKTTGTNQVAVTGTIVLTVTGPGLLSLDGSTAWGKSVSLVGTSAFAYLSADGTAGVTTITPYIGATALTQAAKTVTFTGKATSFVASIGTWNAEGGNLQKDDSATAGIVTFLAKDSASAAVSSAALNKNAAFFAISSDTKVVVGDSLLAYKACTLSTASTGKWTCSMNVADSGTATITIADSYTVASSAYTSNAVSVIVAGAAFTGTVAFDKASYSPGEKAIITVTSKDRAGRVIKDGASNPFTLMIQNKAFSSGNFGGSTGTTWDLASSTFYAGVETYTVYMPSTAGDVTLTGYTSYDSITTGLNTPVSVKATVVDPNAAGIAAAKDASDAATDAALEATDAAYAATDAANIAAEAADAATAAAEAATEAANAAKESADAATAAVEELATSVAKLMAALQAQITTLAKVVAKIAVKVKA